MTIATSDYYSETKRDEMVNSMLRYNKGASDSVHQNDAFIDEFILFMLKIILLCYHRIS